MFVVVKGRLTPPGGDAASGPLISELEADQRVSVSDRKLRAISCSSVSAASATTSNGVPTTLRHNLQRVLIPVFKYFKKIIYGFASKDKRPLEIVMETCRLRFVSCLFI